jgi:hypothetical protein
MYLYGFSFNQRTGPGIFNIAVENDLEQQTDLYRVP